MWDMHDGMGWWMVFGSVWVVVFWAALVWFVVSALNRKSESGQEKEDSPLEIAKRRYARGELSREQYEQIRGVLTS